MLLPVKKVPVPSRILDNLYENTFPLQNVNCWSITDWKEQVFKPDCLGPNPAPTSLLWFWAGRTFSPGVFPVKETSAVCKLS